MKLLSLALLPALALGALALTGCGETRTTRTSSDGAKDLSGKWNDVDAKTVAADMVQKSTSDSWADDFQAKHNRLPIVKLGKVITRADAGEVIATDIFLKEIRKAFIKSKKVRIKDDASQSREELTDQAGFAEKGKEMAKELAPDFLLKGTISTQNDQDGRQSVRYYQIDLELTDIQSSEVIWGESTKIRKEVEQSRWK